MPPASLPSRASAFALKVESGADITAARQVLGHRWGLGRDLTLGELGMLLRLRPESAWKTVVDWENGKREPSGPVCVAIELMLAGGEPSHKAEVLAPTRAATSPRGPNGIAPLKRQGPRPAGCRPRP